MKTATIRVRAERTAHRKKDVQRKKKVRDTVLLFLSVGFLLGGVLGCVLAGKFSPDQYLLRFVQDAAKETMHPSIGRVCWLVFRWPAALLLFRCLPFAGVSIPVLFFLRGCSLSYSIAALASIPSGLLYAGVLFSPSCLLAVPALFLLGSEILLRKADPEGEKQNLLRKGLLCAVLFLLSAAMEYKVLPALFLVLLKGTA